MSLDEVLELAAGLVLSLAAAAAAFALVPPAWAIAASLAVLGGCLSLLSLLAKRASRPVVKDRGDRSLLPNGQINIGRSDS
jgi:membrane protein implicated in regulation of membrane protease activity